MDKAANLTGKMLIAMPGMRDPRFEQSVILICAHSDDGAMGLVVALWFEPLSALGQVTAKSWAAWVYLLVFGTMVALNAYLWLLQNTTAALAGSYSFVNPAVALLVGVALGGELLTGWVFAALPLIAGALGCILYGPMVLGWWQRRVLPRLRAAWAPTGCQEQG